MKEVVIIGAGKIGRGYMAQIFFENGYKIVFVDILPELIAALNSSGSYNIHEVDTGVHDIYPIDGVQALAAEDSELVSEALSRVSIAVTSVGAGNLPAVAKNIAAAIRYRKQHQVNTTLNILVAENLMNGAQKFTDMIHQYLDSEEIAYMTAFIGIVGTVIGRTVPPPPPAYSNRSIADVIVEPHREFYLNQNDVLGELPVLSDVHVTDQYDAVVARKLYVHNCGHAVMGFLGHYFGHQYSHQAMADARVAEVVWQVMQETAKAVEHEFGFAQAEMEEYNTDLYQRYQNMELGDTLVRIGKDPIRKLQPDDRLIGAARLVENTGGEPSGLSMGIAAALLFHSVEDPVSITLQDRIVTDGIESILETIAKIDRDESLGKAVLTAYHHLRRG